MNTSAETSGQSAIDWLKWIVVYAVVGAGVFGNWYYQDQSMLYRVLGLLVLAIVALLTLVQTQKGRAAWDLLKDARSEIRRVVWPTRQETVQTTMIVLVLIMVFSLILWLLDSGLSWLVSTVIG
ncbi:MAG: preprotein translocase subunit SecE [Gammaproteobacteria bacterium]|nr:MAG: preprotein translocase subunit SecE [Gammaproteobacteria bacterium]